MYIKGLAQTRARAHTHTNTHLVAYLQYHILLFCPWLTERLMANCFAAGLMNSRNTFTDGTH